jgi:hypothetical protein
MATWSWVPQTSFPMLATSLLVDGLRRGLPPDRFRAADARLV